MISTNLAQLNTLVKLHTSIRWNVSNEHRYHIHTQVDMANNKAVTAKCYNNTNQAIKGYVVPLQEQYSEVFNRWVLICF